MKGTRPLDDDEIRRVAAAFTGMYEVPQPRFIHARGKYWWTDQRAAQPTRR